MCADPKMQRLLWAELRDELAAHMRTGSTVPASGNRTLHGWRPVALAAAICLTLLIVL